jgi:hypothetical protein
MRPETVPETVRGISDGENARLGASTAVDAGI